MLLNGNRKIDLSKYATKEELDNAIANVATGGTIDLSTYARLTDVNRVLDERLDGKTLVVLTTDDYNALPNDEKNDTSILYFISDAEEIDMVQYNKMLDTYANKEYVEERINVAMDNKRLKVLTRDEYDNLTEADKADISKLYIISDEEDFTAEILKANLTLDRDGTNVVLKYNGVEISRIDMG